MVSVLMRALPLELVGFFLRPAPRASPFSGPPVRFFFFRPRSLVDETQAPRRVFACQALFTSPRNYLVEQPRVWCLTSDWTLGGSARIKTPYYEKTDSAHQ